jgi:hypothetical protein
VDGTLHGMPPARALVAAGLALEALVLAGYAIVIVVVAVRGDAADMIGALVLGASTLALAAGLAAVTAGVARARRWARSPALVWQVLQIAVAVPALSTAPWLAAAAVALALGVGAGVLFDAVLPPDG